MINGNVMRKCTNFKYLGSEINITATCDEDMNHNIIRLAWAGLNGKKIRDKAQNRSTAVERGFKNYSTWNFRSGHVICKPDLTCTWSSETWPETWFGPILTWTDVNGIWITFIIEIYKLRAMKTRDEMHKFKSLEQRYAHKTDAIEWGQFR